MTVERHWNDTKIIMCCQLTFRLVLEETEKLFKHSLESQWKETGSIIYETLNK